MKLKAQVRFPVCVLYSIAFWLFRISPDAKLGGILQGGRRRGRGREREREGWRESEGERGRREREGGRERGDGGRGKEKEGGEERGRERSYLCQDINDSKTTIGH